MSDSYEALFDPEATEANAHDLAKSATNLLLEHDIILPNPNCDCVLGGTGYPPGKAVPSLYVRGDNEYPFWEAQTNGVEVIAGRWFNMFGTTVLEWIACPNCQMKYKLEGEFGDRFGEQVGAWLNEQPTSPITCDSCRERFPIAEWKSRPHLGFSMMTLQFWNWPPLDLSSWKIDICKLLSDNLGHKLIRTWGHV